MFQETWLDPSVSSSELIPKSYSAYRKNRNFEATGRSRGGGVLLALHEKFNATVVYVPPDVSVDDFEYFVDCVENLLIKYEKSLFVGDLNVSNFLGKTNDAKSNCVHNMASFLNIVQSNTILNWDGRYHPALYITVNVVEGSFVNFPGSSNSKDYSFSKANFPVLYEELLTVDWSSIYSITDANNACDVLYRIINNVLDKHVPRVKYSKPRFPKWYSDELKGYIKLKEKKFNQYKLNNLNTESYKQFCGVRRIVKQLISRDFRIYIRKLHLNDVYFEKPKDIVDAFARHSSSTFSSSTPNQVNYNTSLFSAHNNLNVNIVIDESEVLRAMKKLKDSRTSGSDQIPNFVIRDCSSVFSKPLLKCLLTPRQDGFFTARSTLTNLTCISKEIISTFESMSQLDVIYLDYSKPFDTVDHELLLFKLSSLGLSESITKFFASYLSIMINGHLSDHYTVTFGVPQGSTLGPLLFSIFINDITSSIKHSKILIFADDIKLYRKVVNNGDCGLLQHDLNEIHHWSCNNCLLLNNDKCNVVTCLNRLNVLMFEYSINNVSLIRCSEIKDLGVWFDSHFTFKVHIDFLATSALKILGFILRICKDFDNIQTLKHLLLLLFPC
ncbi:uncharacterized protein LOC135123234 [Zophobas morio]|uniref:uncharacterized protein LOC135123234 n=1 Tax=Zophobas morio TaxID=2755281 RepID=UPI00308358DD